MTLLFFVVAVVNLGLGYGLAVYMKHGAWPTLALPVPKPHQPTFAAPPPADPADTPAEAAT